MRLLIVADHEPDRVVEFNGQTPPITWRPKVSVTIDRVVYRPGVGAIVHVRTNGGK
jgi:hypothetical protein